MCMVISVGSGVATVMKMQTRGVRWQKVKGHIKVVRTEAVMTKLGKKKFAREKGVCVRSIRRVRLGEYACGRV